MAGLLIDGLTVARPAPEIKAPRGTDQGARTGGTRMLAVGPALWLPCGYVAKGGRCPVPSLVVPGRHWAALLAGLMLFPALAAAGPVLDRVRERGALICGVSQGIPGFSDQDAQGRWQGLDVDYCRAVAAVVLGDPEAVTFEPLSANARIDALRTGQVDVLARNTTWTSGRDGQGIDFVGILYHDGQGFMVPKALGLRSAYELDGATVCVTQGTTTEKNLADFFRVNDMDYSVVAFERTDAALDAYTDGRCDAYTSDRAQLAALRLTTAMPDDHIVLPETVSKEPLSPAVSEGDDQFADIARWTLFALIAAEELGVRSDNIEAKSQSDQPAVRRLLGLEGGNGLGLDDSWASRAIKAVGNYGEIFARNVGSDSPLGLARGLNAQFANGGLLYAPPIR